MRGENIALRNLSLQIGAGEHVAILGPNGCGKSTLIKTITRECYPLANPESHVAILGRSVWNVVELRAMLGIVTNDLMAQCTREITGFDTRGNAHVIHAEVPLATMFGYVNHLRSMTQGRATYTMQFARYAQVPAAVAEGIVYR